MAGPTSERVVAAKPIRINVDAGAVTGVPHHTETTRFVGKSGIEVVAPVGHTPRGRLAHLRSIPRPTHGQTKGK